MSLQQVLAEILSLRAEVASLKAMLGNNNNISSNASVATTSSSGKGKEGKKKRQVKKDENGKAILSDWTRFTQRVSSIMKELELPNGVEAITHASSLKKANEETYMNLTDDEIKESLEGVTFPEKPKKETKAKETKPKGKGKAKETKVVAAVNVSSPGDDEEQPTNNIIGGSSSIPKPVEVDFGGDDSDEEEEQEQPEEEPIVFKGKKYWHNVKTHELHARDAEDKKGELVGTFITKDPQTGKSRIEPIA